MAQYSNMLKMPPIHMKKWHCYDTTRPPPLNQLGFAVKLQKTKREHVTCCCGSGRSAICNIKPSVGGMNVWHH